MTENSDQDKWKVSVSATPENDIFWNDIGKEMIKGTIDSLDERSKFMITTCAALIVGDSGFLAIAEKLSLLAIIPQIILGCSTIFFTISYFPRSGSANIQSPKENENTYNSWFKWKYKWQRIGYAIFIVGLFSVAITSMINLNF